MLTGHGNPELIPGSYVAEGLFPALRVNPAMGRGFFPAEDQPSANPGGAGELQVLAAASGRRSERVAYGHSA